MSSLLISLFLVGFFLNLAWEFPHSTLYTTCKNMPTGRYVKLICAMSAKDSFWILLFFLISAFLFQNISIMQNYTQLGFFVLLSLGFAFIDEKISTKMGRWEYAPSMPTVFGVGITPLLEIAVTGILTFLIVF